MDLVNELENDLAQAILVEKENGEKIDSKDILPLINKIREALQPISSRDHLYGDLTPKIKQVSNLQ